MARGAAGFREIVIHLVFLSVDGKDIRDYPIRLCGRMTLFGVTVDYYHTGGSGSDATPPQKRQFD